MKPEFHELVKRMLIRRDIDDIQDVNVYIKLDPIDRTRHNVDNVKIRERIAIKENQDIIMPVIDWLHDMGVWEESRASIMGSTDHYRAQEHVVFRYVLPSRELETMFLLKFG